MSHLRILRPGCPDALPQMAPWWVCRRGRPLPPECYHRHVLTAGTSFAEKRSRLSLHTRKLTLFQTQRSSQYTQYYPSWWVWIPPCRQCSIRRLATTNHWAGTRQPIKVVALANTSKSNLNNFWWIGTVVGLISVSAVLWRSLLACMSYRRKKEMKIVSNSKCYLIN